MENLRGFLSYAQNGHPGVAETCYWCQMESLVKQAVRTFMTLTLKSTFNTSKDSPFTLHK